MRDYDFDRARERINEGDTEEGRYRMWAEGRSEVNIPPPEWIRRRNHERIRASFDRPPLFRNDRNRIR